MKSGIENFDEEIGEIPKGSLIIILGGPGTGKTTFCLGFTKGGCESGERCVYVSFVEGRDGLKDHARGFGIDLDSYEESGMLKLLEVPTMKEGMEAVLSRIVDTVASFDADRLILDSFSAIRGLMPTDQEVRAFVQNVFLKILKDRGVTTIISLERVEPDRPDVEEYVADTVIELRQRMVGDVFVRELFVRKFRGRSLKAKRFCYTLHRGFNLLRPTREIIEIPLVHEVVRDYMEGRVVTGIRVLDEMLGGGLVAGTHLLIHYDEFLPMTPISFVIPVISQFLSMDRGVVVLPPLGMSPGEIEYHLGGIDERVLERRLRVFDYSIKGRSGKRIGLKGEVEDDYTTMIKVAKEVSSDSEGPTLVIVGLNTFENAYGLTTVARLMPRYDALVRDSGYASLIVTTDRSGSLPLAYSMASRVVHFFSINDTVFFRMTKPIGTVFSFTVYQEDGRRRFRSMPMV